MKVSESWLKEWVSPLPQTEQLAALLTMAGLEVDAINPVAGIFTEVIVAQVKQTKPHPQADRLTLCEIDTGGPQLLRVVCGAKNVRAGLKVALAQIGAKLPSNLEIKETTLRGELSQGMLCSAVELGMAESSEGILELAQDAPVGVSIREYLHLDDHVLDIDLTPNRADCLSVLGIAREVAAVTEQSFKSLLPAECLPSIDDVCHIEIQAQEACPQYFGRIIRGINSAAMTPVWLSERLRRAGIRAIHPVVDVTNYVMLELGQPMHAFDLQKINGGITVRFANQDEQVVLLDGKDTILSNGKQNKKVMVIADQRQVLAIAGVMGGAASAVTEESTDIFLESAFFTPIAVAGVARSYGLATESSQRFERGVDPTLQRVALERATELLLAITGGKAGPISSVSHQEYLPKPAEIVFHPQRVKELIGLDLPYAKMKKMLLALGMVVSDEDGKGSMTQDTTSHFWKVRVPPYRVDIALDVDLIEEIVRLNGYDNIPCDKMVAPAQPGSIDPLALLTTKLTQFFMVRGYHETITYSFVDPKLQTLLFPNAQSMNLLNPLSSELSSMRVSLWPGLLASMLHNYHRQQASIKLFESGVVFTLNEGQLTETPCFAGLMIGEVGATNWLLEKRSFDFYDLKGDLQDLLVSLRIPAVEFRPVTEHISGNSMLHPGKSAQLLLQGKEIGWCGVLHPCLAEALDCAGDVIVFELQLDKLQQRSIPQCQPISKFPFIRRDLSLLVDKSILLSDIESVVRQVVHDLPLYKNWLKSFDVFDLYVGETIPENKKSLAVTMVLQNDQRTLVDSEINEIIDAIIKMLGEKLAITLRE